MPLEYEELETALADPREVALQAELKEFESDCARLQMDLADIDETLETLENKLTDANARHAKELRERAEIRARQGAFERQAEPQIMDDPARLERAGLKRVIESTQLRRKQIEGRQTEADYWRRRTEQELTDFSNR